jgi:hypothetical protein
MAVRDDDSRGRTTWWLRGLAVACAVPALACADADVAVRPFVPALAGAAILVSESPRDTHLNVLWRDLWRNVGARVRSAQPDWLHLRSGHESADVTVSAGAGALCLVVQEDRPDGTELLTARYTLLDRGDLRAYAGAGLNRAQYFGDTAGEAGPTLFTRRNRHTSMGAAAEVGAELQLSERMLLNAGVRWADLHEDAEALRSEHGPVAADPLLLGFSVGYRFR